MKHILAVVHTPSKNTKALATAVENSLCDIDVDAQIVCKNPTDCRVEDVLAADAIVLGTTENLGYMAGLTKDFFDRCYYGLLDTTQGKPCVVYIRAGHDGTGTLRALQTINNGLKWKYVQEPLIFKGSWDERFIDTLKEHIATLAVGLDVGLY